MAGVTSAAANGASFLDRICAGKVLVADGATGTYLQARGLEPGGDPEAMNLTHPEIVAKMAEEYFQAGSDLIQTNSFGGSRFMQAKYGFGDRSAELCVLAAGHAKSKAGAFGSDRYVAGSMGPTGELMEPVGEIPASEIYDSFCEQASALERGGVDLLVIETMISVAEAEVAVRAARDSTSLPIAALATLRQGTARLFHHDGRYSAFVRRAAERRRGGHRGHQLRQWH